MIVPRVVRLLLICCLLLLAAPPVQARGHAPAQYAMFTLVSERPTSPDALITLIKEARTSILIESRAIDDPTLAHALIAARARGVDVRVMADPQSSSSTSVLGALAAADVWTRRGNPALPQTGQATAIVDGTVLALSNTPFTLEARQGEHRFLLLDLDHMDVLQATSIFYDDWERRSPKSFGDHTVLAPADYAATVVSTITGANGTLDIMAGALTNADVLRALIAAAQRHVSVRVLFDPGVPSAVVQQLLLAQVAVRLMSVGFAGAAIAADHDHLLLGSAALTDSALQTYRELGLLVKDAGVLSVYDSAFDAEWRASAPIAVPTVSPTPTITPTPSITPTPTTTPIPSPTPKGYHPPTKTPTPRPPTRTPTASPTATPMASATPSALSLNVSYAHAVRIGSTQRITVRTSPGARVSVTVTYPDLTSNNPGTTSGIAGASGTFSDSWVVSITTNPGIATATIIVTGGSLRKSASISFTITF